MKAIKANLSRKEIDRYKSEAQSILRIAENTKNRAPNELLKAFAGGRTDRTRDRMRICLSVAINAAELKLGLRPYESQVIGALAMIDNKIAEMATGEGKTLAAALAVSWLGLGGKVHVMTANDYLAGRDSAFTAPFYEHLQLTSCAIIDAHNSGYRQIAYRCDIVYGTVGQFIFDYLRDNNSLSKEFLVQTGLNFALIDEADSILIDEAQTPFILSAQTSSDQSLAQLVHHMIEGLQCEEALVDERSKLERMIKSRETSDKHVYINPGIKSALLTELGHSEVESALVAAGIISQPKDLYLSSNQNLYLCITAALKANFIFKNGVDYSVVNSKVVVIDSNTGRLTHGRRWCDGVHEAIEVKEGVQVESSSLEIGKISLPSFLNMYSGIGGMTGTAQLVEDEIFDLYGISTVVVPLNKACARKSLNDMVFATKTAKLERVAFDVAERHKSGQPILIGTSSVAESNDLSKLLDKFKVPHSLLNALQTEQEADVVAKAGAFAAVTISTNMSGRGTDIVLGGHESTVDEYDRVVATGGLHVIGVERLESRRLDMQLAGRAGRQGDPGSSQFYISIEDTLLKNLGGKYMSSLFKVAGVDQGGGMGSLQISTAIEKAQIRAQSVQAEQRKKVLEHDAIMDTPRSALYQIRTSILEDEAASVGSDVISGCVHRLLQNSMKARTLLAEDITTVMSKIEQWGLSTMWAGKLVDLALSPDHLAVELEAWLAFEAKKAERLVSTNPNAINELRLLAIDSMWQQALQQAEAIQDSIHLHGYITADPKALFKRHIFTLFKHLFLDIPVAQMDFIFAALKELAETESL